MAEKEVNTLIFHMKMEFIQCLSEAIHLFLKVLSYKLQKEQEVYHSEKTLVM